MPFLLLVIGGVNAQTTLGLSSATATPDAATLELSLDSASGVTPAAIQWTIQYSPRAVRSLTVESDPLLASAGKAVVCAGDAAAYTCLAIGLNADLIPDGVVARITAVLAPGASAATITVTDALGVSAAGYAIPITALSGTITASPSRRRWPPHCPGVDCR
jgi:hypothetical protein